MNTQQQDGFRTVYKGIVRGLRAIPRNNPDKSKEWIENMLDMEHISRDGRPIIQEFKLSKAANDAQMFDKLKQLVGKVVSFETVSQQRIWNNRIYTDYYFVQNQVPEEIGASK